MVICVLKIASLKHIPSHNTAVFASYTYCNIFCNVFVKLAIDLVLCIQKSMHVLKKLTMVSEAFIDYIKIILADVTHSKL